MGVLRKTRRHDRNFECPRHADNLNRRCAGVKKGGPGGLKH